MAKCVKCARGPIGGEGHLDLFVLKLRGRDVQFVCRTCSTLWVRTRSGDHDDWHETTRELDALTVPGPLAGPSRNL